jgi:hypothetical protein
MIKRGILFISVLLVFSSLIYAAEEFKGFKYSEDTFKVGTEEFSIRLSNDENLLVFKNSIESMGVSKGDCKSTIYYKYCFYNPVIDFDKNLGKLHDYTGAVMPALNISILSLKPEITITRVITSTTPYEYEEVKITVTIKNDGKKQANIHYFEDIDEVAGIKTCNNCFIIDNQIVLDSIINPADDTIFSYTINPKDASTLILSPLFLFDSETQNGTIKVNSITITPKKPLQVTYSGNKKINIELEEDSKIIFKNNEPNEKITFTSELIYDDDLLFTFDEGENKDYKIIFKGSLDPLEQKEFDISLIAQKSGNKNILITTDYNFKNQNLQTNTTIAFEKIIQKPTFKFNLDQNIFSDNIDNVELIIDNSLSKNSFKDMYIKIEIDNEINETFIVPFLKFSRVLTAYKNNFSIISDTDKTVQAKITVDYKTMFNEVVSQEIKKDVKVKSLKSMISIEHNIEDFKQKEGDLIISTFLKNNNKNQVILNVSETILNAQVLTNDARGIEDYMRLLKSQDLYIDYLSKKQAFSYLIRKNEFDLANISTKIFVKGAKSLYLIESNSIVDFNAKTIKVTDTKVEKVSDIIIEEIEISGILTENIELEQTHKYEIEEKEVVQEQEQEQTQIQNKQEETQKITEDTTQEEPKKRNFFQNIIDIILSFF